MAFYHLGADGLARASILAAFVMILQNFLAVTVLQSHRQSDAAGGRFSAVAGKIVANPVIVSATVGLLFSISGMTLPVPLTVGPGIRAYKQNVSSGCDTFCCCVPPKPCVVFRGPLERTSVRISTP